LNEEKLKLIDRSDNNEERGEKYTMWKAREEVKVRKKERAERRREREKERRKRERERERKNKQTSFLSILLQ
jgi:hypothetical protein